MHLVRQIVPRSRAAFVAMGGLLASVLGIQNLQANSNDIRLRGLGRPQSNALNDPAVQRYQALSGELALSLTPKGAQPAETLGLSGFEFSIVNTISNINQDQGYWTGQPGSPVFEGVADGGNLPTVLYTPTLQVRKGLPMSIDVGVAGSYLASSRLFMLGGDIKVALHESYIEYMPAIALRASFNELFGSEDLDIFTVEADLLFSYPFAIKDMAEITPYVGFGQLFAHVNSEVIDETPFLVTDELEQRGGQTGSLYSFPTLEWNDNTFWKVFAGVRVISATVHLSYTLDVSLLPYQFVESSTLLSHSFKIGLDI